MARIELPYGTARLVAKLPDEWLAEVAEPQPVAPATDAASRVAAALAQPIGAPPLASLAQPGQRVAVIVDDYTRKTPAHLMLPPVLEQLLAAGIRQEDICLVAALGTHRPMTGEELEAKLGTETRANYRVINVPSKAEDEMVYLGTASNGIPAWVNRAVAEANLRIGLGMITPHMDAGFSGGAKIILPGVCSSRTVDAFHTTAAFIRGNQLGKVDAPLRCNLEQFVMEQVPLDFILNAIITLEGKLYRCVAGHAIQAHRAGVEYAKTVFGTALRRRYPVVVANCAPYDVDWWQSSKGAWAGDLVTADGGTLVLVTAAPEGNSTYPLVPTYVARDPEEVRSEIRDGTAVDANQAAAAVLIGNLKRRVRLVLVSGGLTPADAATMRIPYYPSVEAAVAEAVTRLPASERTRSVAVLPQGGIILPVVGSALEAATHGSPRK